MSDLDELKERLAVVRQWCETATGEEWATAYESRLKLERELALAKGEETAAASYWTPQWDVGAPEPHVLCSAWRTLLLYFIAEHDPDWDGSYVDVVDPSADQVRPIALVEFQDCYAIKFGGPNDEVLHGHPLSGRGLGYYGAHEIKNSRWIAEERQIQAVHENHIPARWDDRRHFLLVFHDQTVECIATGYRIEELKVGFPEALEMAQRRLLETGERE
jgi:hypothetical protein